MKKFIFLAALAGGLAWTGQAIGWDGFDAESADLVAIIPDRLPPVGGSVEVYNYDTDSSQSCIVESVTRNRRTTEVGVRAPDGTTRILVMEGR